MPKYRVYAIYTASKCLGEFEAENQDKAEEMADKSGNEHVSICHQCAHEFDLGECYEYQTEEV